MRKQLANFRSVFRDKGLGQMKVVDIHT
jgi:hypothetical protein